ncbi:NUDIX domain-containing protein [Streptomyces anulatus]|uniref:NUDIX domain-containing protein n=1 Tax=Streptomyces anulatus TaxID=1892 RepID=UPI003863F949|nr:NUDIX domain-containing protein [Streptomyces anulatus]WTE07902.1 NUDIX domain-containing protein [Streptomyces anulatus]
MFLAHTRQDSANPRGGPGGHLEPTDATLVDVAVRELAEETGLDPAGVTLADPVPAYVEYGRVPARPEKGEPDHFHLDLGYAFTTDRADVGQIQEAEVTGAAWVPLADAERLVGPRIARAVSRTARRRLTQARRSRARPCHGCGCVPVPARPRAARPFTSGSTTGTGA